MFVSPDNLSLGTYRQAALSPVNNASTMLASMPSFDFGFVDSQDNPIHVKARTGHLDTGSNISMVSKAAFEADRHLYGPAARLVKIKPFPIELADGDSHAYVHEILKDAVICVGHAKYDLDLLIAPVLAVDYLFGNNFIATWDVTFRPKPSVLTMGVEPQNYLHSADQRKKKRYTVTQEVPVKYRIRRVPMPTREHD